MRLKLVRVRSYKRLAQVSKLDTRGPLIAIIGPNEAGKTSLLEAMAHISSREPFHAREFTRSTEIDNEAWVVRAEFSLEPDDRALLGDLVPKDVDLTYSQNRYPQGDSKYSVIPRMPRDTTQRDATASELQKALKDGWLEMLDAPADEKAAGEPDGSRLFERATVLAEQLGAREDWLSDVTRQELGSMASAVRHALSDSTEAERLKLPDILETAAQFENEAPPEERIRDVLSPRVPQFLLFDDAQRALDTEYVWSEHPSPPPALENLFALAKTDYQQFRGHAEADDRPTLEMMLEAANDELDEAFRAWRQADLHVTFSADQRSLQLLIRDRATTQRTRLDERSAGLRSFVALIAFCARYGVNVRPVLMVDEAETHLHYGGQADLIRVFERQQAAETIIYTTHSIGCLPSDLGATIRVVSPIGGEPYRSTIYNSFWAAEGTAGLTPMMLAMGANALAFTPSRLAVIGEGASEAILFPSLVREALPDAERDDPLGYQVAPGVAEVDPEDAEALEMEAGGVAYLIDGDGGGRGHKRKLSKRAKDEGRVIKVGEREDEAQCIEDLVAADALAEALNKLLARRDDWCGDRLTADELPARARASFLQDWCQERGVKLKKLKAALAQEALDVGRDRGALLEPARAEQVRQLHAKLMTATETTTAPPQDE